MRTREEIEIEKIERGDSEVAREELMLEVLLDIRDLLMRKDEFYKYGNGTHFIINDTQK